MNVQIFLFLWVLHLLAVSPYAVAQSTSQPNVTLGAPKRTSSEAPVVAAQRAPLTTEQLKSLRMRKQELREEMGRQLDNNPPSPPGLPYTPVPPAEFRSAPPQSSLLRADQLESEGLPTDLVFGRNNQNSFIGDDILAEPAAVQQCSAGVRYRQ